MTNAAYLEKAQTHLDQGRWQEAEHCCRKLLKDEPNHTEAMKKLGVALYFQHKWPAAAEVLKKCAALRPGHAETLHWLLAACRESYDTSGMYETALKLRGHPFMPDDEVMVYAAFEDACAWRDAGAVQKRALALPCEGKITVEQIPYLMVLLNHVPGISPAVIYDIHRVWGDSIMQRTKGVRLAEETPPPSPAARIKIAYLSADFREHPIGKFIRTIFASHDHHRFEIYCYVHMLGDDAITDEIRLASDHFVDITELDDEALARRIHADGIHILVEIGGHMAHSRLVALAWKPAPVQITYLAQPNTTALPTVDFRITDPHAEANGGTRYAEKLLYMPESFLCMGDLPDFERIATTPAEKNGYITFASFNGVRKFNPGVIAAWCKILKRVKDARLVIKSPGTSVPIVRNNLLKEFKRHGIAEERLEFVEYCTFQEHADWHNKVDIALDTFPYNGTTTTFDTLWMGVPVVTFVGKLHAQRTSYSILKNIGFDEAGAAFSSEEYVNKAVHLAEHPETLSFLRRCLPTMIKHSILFQPERFTAQLEALYIRAWQKKMGPWQRQDHVANSSFSVDHEDDDQAARTDAPARIYVAGMPRAGVAWIHRIITEMTSNHHQDTQPQVRFLHAPSREAIKAIRSDNATVFHAMRDMRDVAIVLMDMYRKSFEEVLEGSLLNNTIADDEAWEGLAGAHGIRYENIVDAPEDVVRYIGTCLGRDISDEDAAYIVKSCGSLCSVSDPNPIPPEVVGLNTPHLQAEPSESGTQEETAMPTVCEDIPPGIHRSRLDIEQTGRLQNRLWSWLEKHGYVQAMYPSADNSKALNINMRGDVSICLPASLSLQTTYMLLEQEDRFEPEIEFLRKWITPGMRCADIGAGVGCFTLAMARLTGPGGQVWAFEPSSPTADLLYHSIRANGFKHCHLSRLALSDHRGKMRISLHADPERNTLISDEEQAGPAATATEIAATVLVDDVAVQDGWHALDVIRISTGGHEARVLKGGQAFLGEHAPLLMIEYAPHDEQRNTEIANWLATPGYSSYALIPALAMLVPFNPGELTVEAPCYLFFCKQDLAKKLQRSGCMAHPPAAQPTQVPKQDFWTTLFSRFAYVERLASSWSHQESAQIPGATQYKNILNMVSAAWHEKTSARKRLAYLQTAWAELAELVDAYANIPRLLTLARIAIELGHADTARQALDSITRHFREGHRFVPEEPFLAASPWAETIDPGDHPAEWCLAQAIHARIKYTEQSSWHTQTGELDLLETFRHLGFPNAEMERRRQLVLMRHGLCLSPEPHPVLASTAKDNLNPDFWKGEPPLIPNPAWEIVQSVNKAAFLCSFPKSGNTMARVVLEHYFQRPVCSTYANDVSALFGGGRENPVAIKCHEMRDIPPGRKMVYIHRDPRDVLISLFKWDHQKNCTEAPKEFDTFIRQEAHAWKRELNNALAYPGPKLMISYDDMVIHPEQTFANILSFLGEVSMDKGRLAESIVAASKEKVANILTSIGAKQQQIMPLEKKTSRWRDMLTLEQIRFVQDIAGESLMKKLGYPMLTRHDIAISQGQIDALNTLVTAWMKREHAQPADAATRVTARNEDLVAEIPCDLHVWLPNDIRLMTPYILLEQKDWFEIEIGFIRRMVCPGMHIIDIGANYGCYALTMGKLIGPEGKLWAFEPCSSTASFLKKSIDGNGLNNIKLVQAALSNRSGQAELATGENSELNTLAQNKTNQATERVPLKRLDDCMNEFEWENIDFMKLDAEGEEVRIVEGGRQFFTSRSPLVMFELKNGDQVNEGLIQAFADLGYRPYMLVPGLSLLAPFDPTEPIDGYQLNLFCCKEDRTILLEAKGLLCTGREDIVTGLPDVEVWAEYLHGFPYGRGLLPIWKGKISQGIQYPGSKAYRAVLSAYTLAHGHGSPAERYHYLRSAFLHLAALLADHVNMPRLLSLARIADELGQRETAVSLLNVMIKQIERQQEFSPEEPFLAVSAQAERTDPAGQLANWVYGQMLAQRERLQAFSSYFTSKEASLSSLRMIEELCYHDSEMRHRQQMILRRSSEE